MITTKHLDPALSEVMKGAGGVLAEPLREVWTKFDSSSMLLPSFGRQSLWRFGLVAGLGSREVVKAASAAGDSAGVSTPLQELFTLCVQAVFGTLSLVYLVKAMSANLWRRNDTPVVEMVSIGSDIKGGQEARGFFSGRSGLAAANLVGETVETEGVQVRHHSPGRPVLAVVALSVCICVGLLNTSGAGWVTPGTTNTRRAAASSLFLGLFGGAAAPAVAKQYRPGQVRPPGEDEAMDYSEGSEPPEVVEELKKARVAGEIRRKEQFGKFREWFSEFAKEDQDKEVRLELLGKMQKLVTEDKMLPIGITRQDFVKGVRAVKFNVGCIKDKVKKDPDCKALEKAYMKVLNAVDKETEKSQVR
jgi:hypothetical protein